MSGKKIFTKENEISEFELVPESKTLPLELTWKPKEDITTYELALCAPYINMRQCMSWAIDISQPHFRHFEIVDHNE